MNELFYKHEYLTLLEVEIPKLKAEFIEDLEKLPIERVTWVGPHKIRRTKFRKDFWRGYSQSSMIFLPEITKLKDKWRALL